MGIFLLLFWGLHGAGLGFHPVGSGLHCGILGSPIDQLQTKTDVENFLVHKVSKNFKDNMIFWDKPGMRRQAWSRKPSAMDSARLPEFFYKCDLDGDGRTDLIVNGEIFVIVMDRGKKGYQVIDLGEWGMIGGPVRLVGIDSVARAVITYNGEFRRRDTLVYRLGDFTERGRGDATRGQDFPDSVHFEGLEFSAGGCFGKCPIFDLSITPDRIVHYDAIEYNKERGKFHGIVPEANFSRLMDLLRIVRLDEIDSSYGVGWTDDVTVTLTVRYNGRVKRVSDYGGLGTRGLQRLYGLLYHLRGVVEWEE